MRKTKKSVLNKIENLRIFKDKPIHIILISIILAVLALFLVVFLLIKLFAPQPKTYDEYFETIDQVQAADSLASQHSAVYQPLEQQVGTDFYESEVLGLAPRDKTRQQTSIEIQKEGIADVNLNNQQAKQLGGISTPSELAQFNTGNAESSVAAAKVAESIALSESGSYESELSKALYAPSSGEY